MLTSHRQALLEAAEIALALAGSDEVRAAWEAESSCAGMTVGGLTQHLVAQPVNTVRALGSGPGAGPIPLLDHYARAEWVGADLEAEANVDIASHSNEAAAVGPDAVLEGGREALTRLPDLLADAPEAVDIPWQSWSLRTDDFVTTRLMEIVVHSDDLAASVGLPTPEFPEPALTPVLGLLSGVAVRRHGQAAVVRALSRPQRAPGHVSAF
ncbi:MAG TPA: maleylpyruvate isomerase N-terminal domain-containing protein [Nocardioides sp.]|nr:maleylpyruvate isomerase N-terminal domain-containing protein [Nocardioides sp.]